MLGRIWSSKYIVGTFEIRLHPMVSVGKELSAAYVF